MCDLAWIWIQTSGNFSWASCPSVTKEHSCVALYILQSRSFLVQVSLLLINNGYLYRLLGCPKTEFLPLCFWNICSWKVSFPVCNFKGNRTTKTVWSQNDTLKCLTNGNLQMQIELQSICTASTFYNNLAFFGFFSEILTHFPRKMYTRTTAWWVPTYVFTVPYFS